MFYVYHIQHPTDPSYWCGKTGQYNSMISYHGDNCKMNPNREKQL